MSYYLSYTGIARIATIAAAALITLSSGVFLAIKSGDNSNSTSFQIQTLDGRNKLNATSSGTLVFSGSLLGKNANDIGWTISAGANTACNTTCTTSACVIGEDTSVLGSFVTCADATADRCICAGP